MATTARVALPLLLLLPLACSPSPGPDAAPERDLAMSLPDLAAPSPDLASPLVDLSTTPDLLACKDPNPAGCRQIGCAKGLVCNPKLGCKPSSCSCDGKRGQWICTEDCGGGTCVALDGGAPADGAVVSDGGLQCPPPNPEGCRDRGCAVGEKCEFNGACKPSSCICDTNTGRWGCTKDCGGGICVPAGNQCPQPNPVGCRQTGCPLGQKCDPAVGCKPSACACDAKGQWICTADCGGGTCV